ncbi:MAG: hypothetical protein CMJ58_09720 [Planctomycetaceae bacterium]|nr:hypothetical protein [Planctomycetaceae bacterium]
MALVAAAAPPVRCETASLPCILWVDDDPNVAAGLRRLMRRYQVRLIHAYDGMQGYWMAASQRPDVVITDLEMPKWPGMDLVECVNMNDDLRGVPLIVISGYDTPADRRRLAELGVTAVLSKPFVLEQLMFILRQHVPMVRRRRRQRG